MPSRGLPVLLALSLNNDDTEDEELSLPIPPIMKVNPLAARQSLVKFIIIRLIPLVVPTLFAVDIPN